MREKDVCHHCGADKRDMARLTRERDEARAEVEDLRARTVKQLMIEVEARENARADAARLQAALRLAEGPIAIAASYADQPCEAMGMRVHAKDCARVLPEIRAALAGEGEAKRCAWKQDADGVWHTDCRSSWVYTDGDGEPADHGQRFCHACGAKVDATPYTNEEDEEEVEDEGQMVSSCECCGCEDCGPPTDVDQICEECRDLCEQDVTLENARDA